jgi:hypothetical protein
MADLENDRPKKKGAINSSLLSIATKLCYFIIA